MTIAEYFNNLHSLGIELRLDGDRLKCSAPKGVLTADISLEIKRRKPELLEFLRDALSSDPSSDIPILPTGHAEGQSLSIAQTSLWFVDQMMPGLQGYNLPSVFRLAGPLDVDALERSLTEIITRHEILRATFSVKNGEPLQVIAPPYRIKFAIVDMSERLPITDETFFPLLREDTKVPFNLAQGPLVRVKLIRLGPADHVLFWMTHHMVWDGWSFDIMLDELMKLYSAYSRGLPSPLSPMVIQYGDFAAWQKEWLKSKDLDRQLDYWREQLAGNPQALQMPPDKPRPAIRSYRGGRVRLDIPKSLLAPLKKLAEEEDATVFMVLLAAFDVILYRYSGQSDISVGSPMWGRVRPETERLIGFFTNTVVLRTSLEGGPSFREVIRRVRKACFGAYSNQTMPFERIVELLPEVSKTPLFQTLFSYQDARARPALMGDIKITQLPAPQTDISSFDLLLWFKETQTELMGRLDYNSDIFESPSMERFMGHIKNLLAAVVEQPDNNIATPPIISKEERNQLIVEWNNTHCEFPQTTGIHELFERQAERLPHKKAVLCNRHHISYELLEQRANHMAGVLIKNGARPGSRIGICMTTSIDIVAAVLGVLKTGSCYVPLDPSCPARRLAIIIAKSRSSIIVTDKTSKAALPDGDVLTVTFDEEDNSQAREPEGRPEISGFTSELPACILHVSQPHGTPKPIILTHRAVVNLLSGLSVKPGLAQEDVFASLSPLSLGSALLELFLPLSVGATGALIDRETSADEKLLIKSIHHHGITAMEASPSTWRRLLSAGWKGRPDLKVLCHGEPVSGNLAAELLSKTKEVWNLYGTTETTVVSTCNRFATAEKAAVVGRPIGNTTIYIVDDLMQPVAVGIVGQLLIGGSGVSISPEDNGKETDKRFLRDPFSQDVKAMLFATGDRAKYLADGSIELYGRLDNQLKINGVRISPEEIESELKQHPIVDQCCVVTVESGSGDKRLVAYIVPKKRAAVSASDLQSHLRNTLPAELVPVFFEGAETLPLTFSGLIDRKKLAEIFSASHTTGNLYVAPSTQSEEYVATLWQELLGKNRVGIHENFFEIGGYSMLAVQMFSKIQKKTKLNLPLATLFSAPTIKELASIIDDNLQPDSAGSPGKTPMTGKSQWKHLVPIKPTGSFPPFYCVHGVGGNVLNYYQLVPYLHKEQPLYGLQCRGLDGITAPFGNVRTMAREYVAEIRELQPHGPYFLGGGSMGGLVAFEMAQQLSDAQEPIGLLLMFDSVCPRLLKSAAVVSAGKKEQLRTKRNIFTRVRHSMWCRVRDAYKMANCTTYRFLRHPIPHELRYWCVEQVNLAIAREYSPKTYKGLITMFRASLDTNCSDPFRGWKTVAVGGMEFIEIACKHENMVEQVDTARKVHDVLQKTTAGR
jgi:amino acid adenylation domain-containing protein